MLLFFCKLNLFGEISIFDYVISVSFFVMIDSSCISSFTEISFVFFETGGNYIEITSSSHVTGRVTFFLAEQVFCFSSFYSRNFKPPSSHFYRSLYSSIFFFKSVTLNFLRISSESNLRSMNRSNRSFSGINSFLHLQEEPVLKVLWEHLEIP